MNKILRKRSHKTGMAPGTLLHIGEHTLSKIRLSYLEYNDQAYLEEADVSIDTCLKRIETPLMTWIQVYGVSDPSVISALGSHFHLHSLILEDVLNTTQRAKLDTYEDQVFIVSRFLKYNELDHELKDEQVSIVFGPNYLISFLEKDEDTFKPVKDRIRQGNNRLRKEGPDYLAYALLDLVVDQYFVVLEKVDIDLDKLEEELTHTPKPDTVKKMRKAKREMIFLRKSIWPMRDVISRLQKIEPPLVSTSLQVYLRDVYDHLVQTIDIIEGFRDVVSGMMDVYLSNINIKTNEIMKVLTIVSTIFVPLTFISSLYGMNFEYMPELHYKFGYPLILLLLISIAGCMLYYFHRKRWF
jgi:magnesium transporter